MPLYSIKIFHQDGTKWARQDQGLWVPSTTGFLLNLKIYRTHVKINLSPKPPKIGKTLILKDTKGGPMAHLIVHLLGQI